MPDWEKEKFGVRVGWSNLRSGLHLLQLGTIYSVEFFIYKLMKKF